MDYRDLKLSRYNVDTYYPLHQKVKVITEVSKKYFKGKLIDVGCGIMPYKPLILDNATLEDYKGVDIENEMYQKEGVVRPDFFWNGKTLDFKDNEYDTAMLIEVLEHTPEPKVVLKEIHRILKNEGTLLITVPFLWTLHDVPYDEYRYTPFAMQKMLEETGYEIQEMEAFGGWHASMASTLALYVRRALKGRKKNLLSRLLFPVIKYLYKKDKKTNKTAFTEGMMITGLWCVVKVIKK